MRVSNHLLLLLTLIYGYGGVDTVIGVKVFGLQTDIWAAPRDDVMVSYNLSARIPQGPGSELSTFTVCFWALPITLTSYESYLSLATSDSNNDVLYLYRRGGQHGFYYNGVRQRGFQDFTSPLGLQEWSHYCHIFHQGEYSAYVGGQERAQGPISTPKVPLPIRGFITVGQEQDSLNGGFHTSQIFRGKMALINIYNRKLNEEEVQQQATCQGADNGEIFSSERESVQLRGATVDDMDQGNLCKHPAEFVILPEPRNLFESRHACKRIGYEVFSPTSLAENDVLYKESQQFAAKCMSNYHLWIGATDKAEENVWRTFVNNEVVEPPFELNEPNGGDGENCLLMFLLNGKWVDTSCQIQWPACVPCQVLHTLPLRLRGLCSENEAQTFYETLGYREGKPYLHGYYGYMIYKSSGGMWLMVDTTVNSTIATLELPYENSYPIGRKTWVLNKPICSTPGKSEIEFSISVCNSSQYTCSNGDCVPREKRCNGENDCPDYSDEDNCNMLVLPAGYRPSQPPTNKSGSFPILLSSTVTVLRVVDISDVQRAINVELILEIRWQDPRLTFLNLGDTLEWNKLSTTDVQQIWTPKISFPNVYQGNVNNIDKDISVRKFGTPLAPDYNDAKMDTAYSGDAATLVQKMHVSGSFVCKFEVFYYPFDRQDCFLLLQLSSARQELATFRTELTEVKYLEEELLPVFQVTQCTVTVKDGGTNETRYSLLREKLLPVFQVTRCTVTVGDGGTKETTYSLFWVEFELWRRWTVIVLVVYLPTTMLLCVGYSSLYITLPRIDVRLAVSLTTLLVLYTLFSNTSDSLPVTAYVKMIDVWFFACIFFLFFVTLTHVLTEYLQAWEMEVKVVTVGQIPRGKKGMLGKVGSGCGRRFMGRAERMLVTVRTLVMPFIALVFNLVYWTLLLRQ